jgi:hypothetical protein
MLAPPAKISVKGRSRRLFASDKNRLELLAAYFAEHPRPLPELSTWLAQHGVEAALHCALKQEGKAAEEVNQPPNRP